MQTALASASSNYNFGNHKLVRLLFDNCSQESFIKSELGERLKLRTIRVELLNMKTFANAEENIENLDVVNIKAKSLCGKHERVIEAYSVPVISTPISNQTMNLSVDNYPELLQRRTIIGISP